MSTPPSHEFLMILQATEQIQGPSPLERILKAVNDSLAAKKEQVLDHAIILEGLTVENQGKHILKFELVMNGPGIKR